MVGWVGFLHQPLAQGKFIVLQSTTSTANSGLLDYLLPIFERETGITVHVVAVGSGQAIRNAMNGDGDVILVHARQDEDKFVADGFGVQRWDVMYNDFIIVGPRQDPAMVRGMEDAAAAFKKIALSKVPFISRGDDSGTHKMEMSLWRIAGMDPTQASGQWYRESGSSMGATINIAVETQGYLVSDRGTWISFKNKGDLEVLVEGNRTLYNPYGIILVNPKKHPHVKAQEGQVFIDWMVGAKGQKVIEEFKVNGESLFFPNATKK
ncbi:MAG TPA: solute-binding protein [Magnetococcales bacterium]|nr:solute-binding protein [Magnetococcales bacterium]